MVDVNGELTLSTWGCEIGKVYLVESFVCSKCGFIFIARTITGQIVFIDNLARCR